MRALCLGLLLLAGCTDPSTTPDAGVDGMDEDGATEPEWSVPAGVVVAQGDMTLRWDYPGGSFSAWVATLYVPEPTLVAWQAFPAQGGGGGGGGGGNDGRPELFAVVRHPPASLPCQEVQPLIEVWNGPGEDIAEARLESGWYHVLVATDNSNGGAGLAIGAGSSNITAGPMGSPLARAAATADTANGFQGRIDENLEVEAADNETWMMWGYGWTGPTFFFPRVDNGYEMRLTTDDGCYDERITGGPVTTSPQSVALRGAGSGSVTLQATYSQQAPTSAGNTQVQAAALVATPLPADRPHT